MEIENKQKYGCLHKIWPSVESDDTPDVISLDERITVCICVCRNI